MEYIDGCKITKAPEHFDDWDYGRDVPAVHEALASWITNLKCWLYVCRYVGLSICRLSKETWHAMQLFLTGCSAD